MSGKSSIQWTDQTLPMAHPFQINAVQHALRNGSAGCLRPLKQVTFALGAIAGRTGRHDVPRQRFTATFDRNDVVPSFRGSTAVSALAIEIIQEDFRAGERHREHCSLMASGMLKPLVSICGVACVACASLGSTMLAARALAYLGRRLPILAATTPRKRPGTELASLAQVGAGAGTHALAIVASRGTSIPPRTVDVEDVGITPAMAGVAPLLASILMLAVLLHTYTHASRCHFERALFCLRHAVLPFDVVSVHYITGGCW